MMEHESITDARGHIACRLSELADTLSLRGWPGRLLAFFLLLGPALLLDTPLALRNPRQLHIKSLESFRDTARQFGEPLFAISIALAIWCLNPSRRRPIILTLVGLLLAG